VSARNATKDLPARKAFNIVHAKNASKDVAVKEMNVKISVRIAYEVRIVWL
jgi:hypothetical protein